MNTQTLLKNDLKAWLKSRGDAEAKLISKAEWERRGECYGRGSKFILVIEESPLYTCLNTGEDKWQATNELTQICRKHGYWYEHCYGWALAFYDN